MRSCAGQTTSHHDARMRMYAMEDGGETTYYTWDENGLNLLTERDASGAGATETYFQYDAANALTHAHALPAHTHAYYSYDKRGNCTLLDEPDGATYFAYNDANRPRLSKSGRATTYTPRRAGTGRPGARARRGR